MTYPNEITELAHEIREIYVQYYNADNMEYQIEHLASEVDELSEAYKDSKIASSLSENYEDVRHTIQDELTDITIMTLALCAYYDMDILAWINSKMRFNMSRESGESTGG